MKDIGFNESLKEVELPVQKKKEKKKVELPLSQDTNFEKNNK